MKSYRRRTVALVTGIYIKTVRNTLTALCSLRSKNQKHNQIIMLYFMYIYMFILLQL